VQIYLTFRLPALSLTTFDASLQAAFESLISVSTCVTIGAGWVAAHVHPFHPCQLILVRCTGSSWSKCDHCVRASMVAMFVVRVYTLNSTARDKHVCLLMQDHWHYAVVSRGSGQPARDLHYKRFDSPSGSCRLLQQDGCVPICRPSISAVRLCDGGSDSQHSTAASSLRLAQVSSRLLGSSGNTRSVGFCLHLNTAAAVMLPSVPAGDDAVLPCRDVMSAFCRVMEYCVVHR